MRNSLFFPLCCFEVATAKGNWICVTIQTTQFCIREISSRSVESGNGIVTETYRQQEKWNSKCYFLYSHWDKSSHEEGVKALFFIRTHGLNCFFVFSSLLLEITEPSLVALKTCFFLTVSPIPCVLMSFFMEPEDGCSKPVAATHLKKSFKATATPSTVLSPPSGVVCLKVTFGLMHVKS